MDTVNIGSKLMKKILGALIARALKSRLGIDPVIQFNDEIKITMDEQTAHLHLNMDMMLTAEELSKLLGV